MNPNVVAIIAAAGAGTRFGRNGSAKQFCRQDGESLLEKSVRPFLDCDFISGVVCVIPQDCIAEYAEVTKRLNSPKMLEPITGSNSRQGSVRNGLVGLSEIAPKHVLIHDAARPWISRELIQSVYIELLKGAQAVVPAVEVSDSVRYINDDGSSIAIDRSKLRRIQTPQGFVYALLLNLHETYSGQEFTDDASLFDMAGYDVKIIRGDQLNKKVTYQSDFGKSGPRVGFGYDVHKFSDDPARALMLCGVKIPGHRGLEAISDGDVAIHAIVDSLLGAIGAGNIGEHFPTSDPANKDINSLKILSFAKTMLDQYGASVSNLDVVIVCQEPKISEYSSQMREVLASYLRIDIGQISIKGKTTEQLGFCGRKEGIAAYASTLICFGRTI